MTVIKLLMTILAIGYTSNINVGHFEKFQLAIIGVLYLAWLVSNQDDATDVQSIPVLPVILATNWFAQDTENLRRTNNAWNADQFVVVLFRCSCVWNIRGQTSPIEVSLILLSKLHSLQYNLLTCRNFVCPLSTRGNGTIRSIKKEIQTKSKLAKYDVTMQW